MKNLFLKLAQAALRLILCWAWAFIGLCLQANEGGLPFSRVYTPREYGAFYQNWSVIQSRKGLIYVANNYGVLEYDGVRWRLIPTGNKSLIYTLAEDERGRIYVGAIGDLGYLEADAKGELAFVSLLGQLPENERQFSEVNNIFPAGDKVYFTSPEKLFCFANGRLTSVKAEGQWRAVGFQKEMVLQTLDKGLVKLHGKNMVNVLPPSQLPVDRMLNFLPLKTNFPKENRWLILTLSHGLHLWEGETVKPFKTEADEMLAKSMLAKALELSDGSLGLGTLRAGFFRIDKQGKLLNTLDKAEGLPSNQILGFCQDRQNGIWLVGDGLSRQEILSPLSRFDERNGLSGSVLSIHRHLGKLYAGTTSGLFCLDHVTERGLRFRSVPDFQEEVWAYLSMGDTLLLGTVNGLKTLKRGETRLVADDGNVNFIISPKKAPNKVVYGMFGGVCILRQEDGVWVNEGLLAQFAGYPGSTFEDSHGDLWVSHPVNGIYRLRFLANGKIETEHFGLESGLPSLVFNRVHGTSHGMKIATKVGVYRFVEATKHFEPDPAFASLFGGQTRWVYGMQEDKQGKIWMHTCVESENINESGMAVPKSDGSYVFDNRPGIRFSGGWTECMLVEDDGVVWFGGPEGLVRLDTSIKKDYDKPFEITLRKVTAGKERLLYGGTPVAGSNGKICVPYSENSLRFEFAALSFELENANRYQILLEGLDSEWSAWNKEPHKDYMNLREGTYRFRVRAMNLYGVQSHDAVFSFEIKPPLYRTWQAYLAYLLSISAAISLLIRWRMKKLIEERDALEQKVLERTAELHTSMKHLEEARKTAEAATRSKSEFLANMSHELRTPMNAIIGFSTLALKMEIPATLRNYVHKISTSAQSLLGLINDILDFSKIEAGKLSMEKTPFDLPDVLTNVGDLFAMKAADKGIELVISSSPEVPRAFVGDPLRLGQVLINLVNNAIKFTAKGYVALRVQLAETAATNSEQPLLHLTFSIQDSGIGMTPEQLGKLFQAFSQADTSTTRKYGGTGLGLTISKKLVEMMGGEIRVTSEYGAGSCFSFSVPLEVDSRRLLSPMKMPDGMSSLKVMVVDDTTVAREVLTEQLESFHFIVKTASSAEEALRALEKDAEPFDLVFMDYQMPDMDGIEASKMIRESDPDKCPAVVMVSAFGREEIMQQAAKAGIKGFLIKPVNPSLLLDTVLEALGKQEAIALNLGRDNGGIVKGEKEVRGAYVLLAEDNLINQEVAIEILARAGVKVDVANNGLEALEKVDRNKYDLVLMDVQMPEMDGYTATERIREKSAHQQLPIIAMTAHAMAGYREECLAVGMNDYVTKPIDPAKLFSVLAKWVHPSGNAESETHSRAGENALPPMPLIPGIDAESALQRLGGNRQLLLKLMEGFILDFSEAGSELEKALTQKDYDSAGTLLHTLRGVSGNLSATDVHRQAMQLEEALQKEDAAAITSLLPPLQDALSSLLKSAKNLPSLTAAPLEAPPTMEMPNFEGSVLIADDNMANRMVAEAIIGQHGLDVRSVEDGVAALADMEENAFDIIFLDGNMPRLDGPSTLAEIRRRESTTWAGKHHHVVALTGLVSPGDRKRLLELGFDDYLPKPMEESALLDVLRQVFQPRTSSFSTSEGGDRWSRLAEVMGGRDGLLEFLAVFQSDSDGRQKRIHEAFEQGDRYKLSREAHDLKSNAASLGFTELSELCLKLERESAGMMEKELQEDISRIDSLLAEAREICKQA